MNLHQKLFEIQKTVTYFQKGATGYQYKYVGGTDVLVPIRAKMDELGVMLFPMVKNGRAERGEAVDDKGKVKIQFFTQVDIDFVWVNVEDSADKITVPWYAQGVDPAEKGVGKAWTYAERYFLLKFFHVPTDNDDPDRFQEKRVEAGKRRKTTGGAPMPPPPTEEPPQAPAPQEHANSGYPPNPVQCKVVNISNPTTGETNGRKWTRWEIETSEVNVSTFDSGVAEVALNAITDGSTVEMIWQVKKSTRTGKENYLAEAMRII